MMWAGALLLSYLIGSIPTAFLLVKRVTNLDIRSVGSGNVGATNAVRAAGKGVGLAVFLVDVGKGVVAAGLIAGWFLGEAGLLGRLLCGLAAVLGHNFPIFLRFRGGKGVAATIGALLGAVPVAAISGIGVWVTVFLLTRYVSVASITLGLAIPILQLVRSHERSAVLVGGLMGALLIVRHQANIQRLLKGSEPRFSFGKSKMRRKGSDPFSGV